jgi:hypothetical protein
MPMSNCRLMYWHNIVRKSGAGGFSPPGPDSIFVLELTISGACVRSQDG